MGSAMKFGGEFSTRRAVFILCLLIVMLFLTIFLPCLNALRNHLDEARVRVSLV